MNIASRPPTINSKNMNELTQLENGIIGSQRALKALQEKGSASILCLSDSHGDFPLVRRIIEAHGKSSDALVFSGDGASDILRLLDMALFDSNLMEAIPPIVVIVRGNNDSMLYSTGFCGGKQVAIKKGVVFCVGSHRIWVTHGHSYHVYHGTQTLQGMAAEGNIDIVIYGHTHIPSEYTDYKSNIYLFNPGSLNYPRSSSNCGFAFLQIVGGDSYATFYESTSPSNTDFVRFSPS